MPEPTNILKVCIVGKGSIGNDLYKKMKAKELDTIYSVDSDSKKGADAASVRELYNKFGPMDVYIIAVWNPDQVLEVCEELHTLVTPDTLISIETTARPGLLDDACLVVNRDAKIVLFQERFNPNDDAHGIFNQPMVMCGDYEQGRKFWTRYMLYENIIVTNNIAMAEISHLVDNSVRYVDIAMAEELQLLVGSKENFDELRRLCNTKWNINIMETRTGIGGHCLKKDIQEINKALPNNKIFNLAYAINGEFETHYGE